jgi:hypothetical protein
MILKFGIALQGWIADGWETFTDVLGFEGRGEGTWKWQMPTSSETVTEPTAPPAT